MYRRHEWAKEEPTRPSREGDRDRGKENDRVVTGAEFAPY